MGYQISEQTRLRQITAEVFVRKGFDGAINLDRESYNFAHPHYQYLVKWLHSALRQLTNRQKEVGSKLRANRREKEGKRIHAALEQKVEELLTNRGIEDLPQVVILSPEEMSRASKLRRDGIIAMNSATVMPKSPARKNTGVDAQRNALAEKKVAAFAQILESWGFFKGLSYEEQELLVREVVEIALFEGTE